MQSNLKEINYKNESLESLNDIVVSAMSNQYEMIREIYKDSVISYNKVLKNYKELANELNLNTSLELSHLFSYMLWNGYYSVSKKHEYKMNDRLMLTGLQSFDVIRGQGVCLAYSELLSNYLNICDKNAAILNCKVPTKKGEIEQDYTPSINRNMKNDTYNTLFLKGLIPMLNFLTNKAGNHAVTLVEDDEKLYLYDVTNLFALNLIDESKASIINGKGEFDIKPLFTSLIIPNADPNLLLNRVINNKLGKRLDRNDYIYNFEKVISLVSENIKVLDDAYDNIHSELEFIVKETDEKGNLIKVLKKEYKK